MTTGIDYTAVAARVQELLADPDFRPDLLAVAIGDTEDAPRSLAESDERLANRRQRRAEMGIAPAKLPPLERPARADKYDCLAFGANCRHTLTVDGAGIATPLPCGKCEPDREWRVFQIAYRYRHRIIGAGDQTIVQVPGFQDVDKARKFLSRQGHRCPRERIALLKRRDDYLWEAIIIYADGLSDADQMLTARAVLKLRLSGSIETRPVPSDEFQALVPREPCVEGLEVNPDTGLPIRRRTCVFTGWPDYDGERSDYLHDDGYIETGVLQTQSEATPLPGWAMVRSKLPIEERAALNAADWCDNRHNVADYIGPSALVSDTTVWLYGRTSWREAYRPMLALMGLETKAPLTVCQGCGKPGTLTPNHLCIRCYLLSG